MKAAISRSSSATVGGTFSMVDGGGHAVAGTALYYLEDVTYTCALTADARSEGGVPLSHPYSFSFTTGPGPQANLTLGNSPSDYWQNIFGPA